MTTRTGRHRLPVRPRTPLTAIGDAVSTNAGTVGRRSAVIAASSGLLVSMGLPAAGATGVLHEPADTASGSTHAMDAVPVAEVSASVSAQVSFMLPTQRTAGTTGYGHDQASAQRVAAARAAAQAVAAAQEQALTAIRARAAAAAAELHAAAAHAAAAQAAAAHAAAPHAAAPHAAAAHAPSAAPAHAAPAHAVPAHAVPAHAVPAHAVPAHAVPAHAVPVHAAPAPRAATASAARTAAPTTSRAAAVTAAPVVSSFARGASAVDVARRYIGVPYRYGGTTPSGFDCSGFVQYVYAHLGVSLPRTAAEQTAAGTRIPRSEARAGDLVSFYGPGGVYHDGIYLGGGRFINAPRTGEVVHEQAIWSSSVVFTRVGA